MVREVGVARQEDDGCKAMMDEGLDVHVCQVDGDTGLRK